MMKTTNTLSAEEMAAIEWNAEYLGVSRLLLMENAGRAVATEILKRHKGPPNVAIFAGLGGNGGDGLVAARHLARRCLAVNLIVVGDPAAIQHPATAENWHIVKKMRHSLRTFVVRDAAELPTIHATVIVDALLGTGVRGAPRPHIRRVLQRMNRMEGLKVAVDVPTGIHPDTGEPKTEAAFRADFTITFHRPKLGLKKNKEYVGKLIVANIGVPPEAELYVGPGDVYRVTQPRYPYTKKGDFGRLLIIGGSMQYVGAPILACAGALRSGVDLVYLAAPPRVISTAVCQFPDLIPVPLQKEMLTTFDLSLIERILEPVNAVLIGPGLSDQNEVLDAIGKVLTLTGRLAKPTIVDADALKIISRAAKLNTNIILTPHAGEFQRIAGYAVDESLVRRAQQVKNLAQMLECVVLLKGPVDIVAEPQKMRYNWTGTPAMSVGGTGDVLAGLISGLRAQGVNSFLAACVGAFLNGAAGQLAFRDKGPGLIASDLVDYIPKVLTDPMASPALYDLRIPLHE